MTIREKLEAFSDEKYIDFEKKLAPSSKKEFIGVRLPHIRKMAKELYGTEEGEKFIHERHNSYDEDNLHSCMLCYEKDFKRAIELCEFFIEDVDNWASCDSLNPKVFKKDIPLLLEYIKKWLDAKHEYTVRFGILMLMKYFMDDNFKPEYAELVCNIKREEYYIKMAQAWYMSELAIKHYDFAYKILSEKKLDESVRRKSVTKACESFRISDERKEALKKLRK